MSAGKKKKKSSPKYSETIIYDDYNDLTLTQHLIQNYFEALNDIRSSDKCPINTSNVQHYKSLNFKPEAICSLVELILENPK